MPLRPLRPCKQAGCIQLTRDENGYCPEHLHIAQESHMEYKRNRTDKTEQAFYKSAPWLKVRALALSRDHGLCQHCLRDGKVTLADMIHHIVELKTDWMLRLTLNNLISLCNGCHNKIPRGK